jgi:predicted nucleotidyltransferase
MDVAAPYRALANSLDVAILVELTRVAAPVTVPELQRRLSGGSDRGLRLALARRVEHGIVRETHVGRTTVYALNDEHLAAPAVVALAEMRKLLLSRIRELVASWAVRPLHASLFGSAARRDGDVGSDIDLLVIRPASVPEAHHEWRQQLESLEDRVRAWTGNPVQISELSEGQLDEMRPAVARELTADAVTLAGLDAEVVFNRVRR